MKPYYQDSAVTLFCGDALSTLQGLPTASVHCCVTSPPFFGLRDYGTGQWAGGDPACEHRARRNVLTQSSSLDGGLATTGHAQEGQRQVCRHCGARRIDLQLGLEEKPDCLGWATGQSCGTCYVCKLVAVFAEVRRVLRMDGTCWVNCGDSYNSNTHWSGGADSAVCGNTKRVTNGATRRMQFPGLKPKDLMLIPSRVALALQADGWYLRSDIAWCKKSPMPESVRDRPTCAHEHIFLFSKSPRYFYDAEAVRERAARPGDVQTFGGQKGRDYNPEPGDPNFRNGSEQWGRVHQCDSSRNLWDYWLLSSSPYPEAHFATFPSSIPRRAIQAGTSAYGCCAACGTPYQRVVERIGYNNVGRARPDLYESRAYTSPQSAPRGENNNFGNTTSKTQGWQPTCKCACPETVPATVLDPFAGSGTTGQVACEQLRHAVLIELNPQYCELIKRRLNSEQEKLFDGSNNGTEAIQPLGTRQIELGI